jgi:hypothetical protein
MSLSLKSAPMSSLYLARCSLSGEEERDITGKRDLRGVHTGNKQSLTKILKRGTARNIG